MTWHGHRLRHTIPYDASNGAERFGTRRAGHLIREIASEMKETKPGVVSARLPKGDHKTLSPLGTAGLTVLQRPSSVTTELQ